MREQLRILLEGGAVSPQTGKGVGDLPGLNPLTMGALERHKLAGSTTIRTSQRTYGVYWLTALGQLAAAADKPAVAKKEKAPKPRRKLATDILGPRLWTTSEITKPGFYRMASEVYHRDPCPAPALSSGLAAMLVDTSPAHAWRKSPRCDIPGSEAAQKDPTYGMDIGSAVHAFAFGDAATDIVFIDAPDWKDSRTRNWRAAARQQGKTPILKGDKDRVVRMAEILIPVLEERLGCALGDAYGEVVIAASEGLQWRRTRCDLLRGDLLRIIDLKTTALTAHPDAASGRLFDGAHLQEALTHHILDAIDPDNAGKRVMEFISIEQDEPHAFSVVQIDAESAAIANQQLHYALTEWDKGVATGKWPAYAPGVHRASMPPWKQIAWRLKAIELGIADQNGEIM